MAEKIIVSGPVIIENGKLLVNKDNKDDFYKLPGGRVRKGESLEEGCIRETKEEINANIELTRKLFTITLDKNPQTGKEMKIELHHYLAKLKNKDDIKPMYPIRELKWLDIDEIKQGKYVVAPNIRFLIKKGDIQ